MTAISFVDGGYDMPDEVMESRFQMNMDKYPFYRDAVKHKRDECAAWSPSKGDIGLFFLATIEILLDVVKNTGGTIYPQKKEIHRVLVPVPLEIKTTDARHPVIQVFSKYELLVGTSMIIDDRIRYFIPVPGISREADYDRYVYTSHKIMSVFVVKM